MSNILKGTVVNPDTIYGKSAYEIAVMNGFDGTEEEWLESLKGDAYLLTEEDKAEINAESQKYINEQLISVTPQMFGAKGDGITDDTVAIQTAIDSGKAVQFAYGCTYLISSAIVIKRSGVLINGNNATIKLKEGCVCNVLEFTAWANATIERLALMGNSSNRNGVYLDGTVTSLRFYQVTVSNNGENGVKVGGYSWGNQFVECNFTTNGDCGFYAGGSYTEGATIGCLSTTDFNMCRFTRNTNAGIVLNGSTNKFYGGWFEGNDIGLIVTAETYHCGNVLLSGVDIEGNTSHAVKFISNGTYGIEAIKIHGGQVCGSTTNVSLLYYDLPAYKDCGVDVDATVVPVAGCVTDSANNPVYVYSNIYPMTGFGEGHKTHVYLGLNRTYLSDSAKVERFVRGIKPSTMWSSKLKYTLSPGECVWIEFDSEVYCVSIKCASAQPIKIGVEAYVSGEFLGYAFPEATVDGNIHSFAVYLDVKRILLRNDGNADTEIGDFLWTGRLPNN